MLHNKKSEMIDAYYIIFMKPENIFILINQVMISILMFF